jgi:periplasmic divalent cation tolerance protein
MKQKLSIISVTFPNYTEANKISTSLVKSKIVACCQIIPKIESIYEWNDKIEKSEEVLVLIKCASKNVKLVEKTIIEKHSYDVPEFIVTEATYVSTDYLNWAYKD